MTNRKSMEEMRNDDFIQWCRKNGYGQFADRLLGRIRFMNAVEDELGHDGEID